MSTSSAASTACKISPAGPPRRLVSRILNFRLIAAAFLGLLVCTQTAAAGDSGQTSACLDPSAEPVQIRHVHDGDTVVRADGERMRLIGIDTPELAREERPAQAGAIKARDHLRSLIANAGGIRARYGEERRDRYGRLLAHLYADGRNLQAELLAAGLATPLFIGPNLGHIDCYQNAAAEARRQQRGLWRLVQYQPRAATSLTGSERGYHVVTGTVQRVGNSRCCIWLNLTRDFALRISRSDMEYFDGIDFGKLDGIRLEARGHIYKRSDQLRMHIRHPVDVGLRDGK